LAVLGYLIYKSGYFPRILGVLMVFAALGYLTHSYGSWLYPNYAETLASVVGLTAIIGELPFFLWLAIKGVNVQRYNERAQQQPRWG
jgi:cytochrome c biogenesis protein CcdA